MEAFDATLLVILGWLLGVLAGPLGDRIRRHYSAKGLRRACVIEINELRYTMASCVSLFSSRLGLLDHDLIDWLDPIEDQYVGPDKEPGALNALRKLRAMSKDELAAAGAIAKASMSGMSLKQYSVSFLDSQLANLGILPLDLQQRLLQVKDQLSLFNQDVSFLNGQFNLTFQGDLGGGNYAAIQQNLNTGYPKLVTRARNIADAITSILALYATKRSG